MQQKNKEGKIRRIIGLGLFIAILAFCTVFFSYLFRNTHVDVRQNVLQLYEEPNNSIDVVVIGASSAYEFWNTMEVWDKYHITSFDYSGSGFCAASTISCIEEVRKTQNPKLILVEARTLISRFYADEINISTRNVFDSMDYDINRLKGYLYFADVNDIAPSDTLVGVLDIMEYHDNHAALAEPLNWQLADNRNDWNMADRQHYKGYCPRMWYNDFDYEPTWTDERTELDSRAVRVIEDIITYCEENNLKLAFFASPMIYTAQDNMEFNAVSDICAEHNVPFFDGNKDLQDIGMNFSEDFYDTVHVNLNGSTKFTDWLADKVFRYYDIESCTENCIVENWDATYEQYEFACAMGECEIKRIEGIVHDHARLSESMRASSDLNEWLAAGRNIGFTIFTSCDLDSFPYENFDEETLALFKNYGIDKIKNNVGGEYLTVWQDSLIYQSTTDGSRHQGVISSFYDTKYDFYWDGDVHLIVDMRYFDGSEIHGEIASLESTLSFVAYNRYTNEYFDAVTVDYDEGGIVSLRHLNINY